MVIFIIKDPSKFLSRNVVCQCEPVLFTLALTSIGLFTVGGGISIRFLPDIVRKI